MSSPTPTQTIIDGSLLAGVVTWFATGNNIIMFLTVILLALKIANEVYDFVHKRRQHKTGA